MLLRYRKRKKEKFGFRNKIERSKDTGSKIKWFFARRVGENIFAIICESKVSQIFKIKMMAEYPKIICFTCFRKSCIFQTINFRTVEDRI